LDGYQIIHYGLGYLGDPVVRPPWGFWS
jgi:hypothetical protein